MNPLIKQTLDELFTAHHLTLDSGYKIIQRTESLQSTYLTDEQVYNLLLVDFMSRVHNDRDSFKASGCSTVATFKAALLSYMRKKVIALQELERQDLAHQPSGRAVGVAETMAAAMGISDPNLRPFYGRMIMTWAWQVKRKLFFSSDPVSDHRMLVITGRQGSGKSRLVSSLLDALPDRYYVQKDLTFLSDKFQHQLLQEHYVFWIEELAGAQRADIERLKDAITSDQITARVMRSARAHKAPNIASFIATSNKPLSTMIVDPTGYRRFFEIDTRACHKYDWDLVNSLDFEAFWTDINENLINGYLLAEDKELLAQTQRRLEIPDDIESLVQGAKLAPSEAAQDLLLYKMSESHGYLSAPELVQIMEKHGGCLVDSEVAFLRMTKLAEAKNMTQNQLTRKLKTHGIFRVRTGRNSVYYMGATQKLFKKDETVDVYTRTEAVRPVIKGQFNEGATSE